MNRYLASLTIFIFLATITFCDEEGAVSSSSTGAEGYALQHSLSEVKKHFNLGPTGIWGYGPHSIGKHIRKGRPDLKDPHFFIVDRAEVGSPAHGVIRKHDVIIGANGTLFEEGSDPRFALAHAIEDSEAKDGRLHLQIRRGGTPMTVTVRLPKVPAWSPTWPLDCKRTDAILTNACDFLQREQMPEGDIVADDGNIGPVHAGLLWLAVGEPQYLQNAIRAAYWYKEMAETGKSGWCWTQGYGGLLLAEYYNMTGDPNILPGLENIARILARGQMPSGGWSHGPYSGFGAGYGEVNCAGMACYMALLEAREIGVPVDHKAIQRAELYYDKFAYTQYNKYGDHGIAYDRKLGYGGLNGKVGGVSVAHRLNNKLEFADLYAIKGARSANVMEGGHTGHFFNMMWTPIAASQSNAKEYRSFMDQNGWYFTMARTWRGGFYCSPKGGFKYSTEGGVNMTTGGYGMVLAAPRRHLRILGSPVSVFVKKDLPAELVAARDMHQSRKWDDAVAAVDAFLMKGGHDAETVRLANELRDKSKYVKSGIEIAYAKLAGLANGSERGPRMGSRPFKVMGIMKHMRQFLGKDNPALAKIEETLPERFRAIWRHDESYHEVFRKLRMFNTRPWFIIDALVKTVIPDFAMPADAPLWTPLVHNRASGWKAMVVGPGQKEPKDWIALEFDDSAWGGADAKVEGLTYSRKGPIIGDVFPKGGICLVRVPFEMTGQSIKQLRIRIKGGGITPGGSIYLNGKCVLNTYSGLYYKNTVTLLDNTPDLLKSGTNVLALVTEDKLPSLFLDAEMAVSTSFDWTPVPGRDSELRELVAKRRIPEPYYEPEKDTRKEDELMAVLAAEPFFMPEVYYALERFSDIVPKFEDRKPYADQLLKSPNWGARLSGLLMICRGMTPMDDQKFKKLAKTKKLSAELKKKEKARMAAGKAWATQYTPQAVKLLEDPNPQVRYQAAVALGLIGADIKSAAPVLKKLVTDVDQHNWYIRKAALGLILNQPIEQKMKQDVIRTALNDPASTVRGTVLGATLSSKDEAVKKASVELYQNELIDQIFTAPHGMFTRNTRSQMAKVMLQTMTKDEIRKHLPRFYTALSRPYGAQLEGSIAVMLKFGDEVRPNLEELAQSDDLVLRYNVIDTLIRMSGKDNMTPDRVAFLKANIQPLLTMKGSIKNVPRSSIAQKWSEALETRN